MPLGTPTLQQLDDLMAGKFWRDVKQYSDDFLTKHDAALRGYGRHWGEDPMHLWSRRWEYPFAAQAVLRHAERTGRTDLTCCDAGSGVTFLPFLLCEQLPETRFACVDTNATYDKMFNAVNLETPHDHVWFRQAALQDLPFDEEELDALLCVSVLEHTGQYATILKEIARVLRPGGRLILTFDLSLDGKFELTPEHADEVFAGVAEFFEADAAELKQKASATYASAGKDLLSTPEVREREPQHLPWKYPRLQAIYDLVRGHGWTGGFRGVAPFCLDVARR
jgi:2-polyprenyl-3-methyl-5-hydroxy-6-metoxy-1,4-benzoquinol methylase